MKRAKAKSLQSIFGEDRTETKVTDSEPTMHLRWRSGVLQQLWTITERRLHYAGKNYSHSTYHKRELWNRISHSD